MKNKILIIGGDSRLAKELKKKLKKKKIKFIATSRRTKKNYLDFKTIKDFVVTGESTKNVVTVATASTHGLSLDDEIIMDNFLYHN